MNGPELARVLEQVTEQILGRMRVEGFVYKGKIRHDPIVWDVNNGWCQDWASLAVTRVPGGSVHWVNADHCVLVYQGRFYDADCPDGVDDVADLPMHARPLHPRPED